MNTVVRRLMILVLILTVLPLLAPVAFASSYYVSDNHYFEVNEDTVDVAASPTFNVSDAYLHPDVIIGVDAPTLEDAVRKIKKEYYYMFASPTVLTCNDKYYFLLYATIYDFYDVIPKAHVSFYVDEYKDGEKVDSYYITEDMNRGRYFHKKWIYRSFDESLYMEGTIRGEVWVKDVDPFTVGDYLAITHRGFSIVRSIDYAKRITNSLRYNHPELDQFSGKPIFLYTADPSQFYTVRCRDSEHMAISDIHYVSAFGNSGPFTIAGYPKVDKDDRGYFIAFTSLHGIVEYDYGHDVSVTITKVKLKERGIPIAGKTGESYFGNETLDTIIKFLIGGTAALEGFVAAEDIMAMGAGLMGGLGGFFLVGALTAGLIWWLYEFVKNRNPKLLPLFALMVFLFGDIGAIIVAIIAAIL